MLDGTVRCSLFSRCLASSGRRPSPEACYFGRFCQRRDRAPSCRGVLALVGQHLHRGRPLPPSPSRLQLAVAARLPRGTCDVLALLWCQMWLPLRPLPTPPYGTALHRRCVVDELLCHMRMQSRGPPVLLWRHVVPVALMHLLPSLHRYLSRRLC